MNFRKSRPPDVRAIAQLRRPNTDPATFAQLHLHMPLVNLTLGLTEGHSVYNSHEHCIALRAREVEDQMLGSRYICSAEHE